MQLPRGHLFSPSSGKAPVASLPPGDLRVLAALQHLLPAQGASSRPPSPTRALLPWEECEAWGRGGGRCGEPAGRHWGPGTDASHPWQGSEGSGGGLSRGPGAKQTGSTEEGPGGMEK